MGQSTENSGKKGTSISVMQLAKSMPFPRTLLPISPSTSPYCIGMQMRMFHWEPGSLAWKLNMWMIVPCVVGLLQQMDNFGRLNTDICFDVLSRLPTKSLIALKCVSKRWHELISNHIFIKDQSQKREPLFGFFFQQRFQWCLDDIETITHITVESEGAGLQHTIFSFLPENVVVMASCNGLVCCRSYSPFHDPSIYVCNPLNREWIRLDWTNPDKETSFALAFDPCCNPMQSSTNFKLVKVRQYEAGTEHLYFSFDIYSSDTGAWRTSKEICLCNNRLYTNKGVFIGGVLHWNSNKRSWFLFCNFHELLEPMECSLYFFLEIMQSIGFLGPTFFLTQLSHIDSPAMAVLCMACSQGTDAFSQSGLYSNHQDIAPRYYGILLGLSNTTGVLAGVFGTATTGYILQHVSCYRVSFLMDQEIIWKNVKQ